MEKLTKSSNGQWSLYETLEKWALQTSIQQPSIHDLIGKTHTVEVHPHLDHLHNIKGAIKESGKPHMSIGDIKKKGFSSTIVDSLPRDANGRVTPEMIDEHIAKLPKQKVQIKVVPYEMASQQHREGVPQYTVSVGLHPENKLKSDPAIQNSWNSLKNNQHDLNGLEDQIGWARIDPFKVDDGKITPNDKHWHVDEIQSDFHQPDSIEQKQSRSNSTKQQASPEVMHNYLSHGHDDPNHLIHSAVNELARKNGIESMSMDTPEDQARQSMLSSEYTDDSRENAEQHGHVIADDQHSNDLQEHIKENYKKEHHDADVENTKNPYLKSALKKFGHEKASELLSNSSGYNAAEAAKDILDSEQSLSDPEKHVLIEYVHNKSKEKNWPDRDSNKYSDLESDEMDNYLAEHGDTEGDNSREVPVHHMNTYKKRPKTLGMKPESKIKILGTDPNDDQEEVQYMRLHKKLLALRTLVKSFEH